MAGINNTLPNPFLSGLLQPKKTAGLVPTSAPQSTISVAPKPAAPAANPFTVVKADPNSLGVAPFQQAAPNPLLGGSSIKGVLTPPAKTPTPIIQPATQKSISITPSAPSTAVPFGAPAPSAPLAGMMAGETGEDYAKRTGAGVTPKVTPQYVPPTTTSPIAETPANPFVAPLAKMAQGDSPEVIAARKALFDLDQEFADKNASVEGTPGSNLTLATGQQGILARQYATKRSALEQALNNAITTQGQRGQFLEGAAALATPQAANLFGYYNPATGQFTQYCGGQGAGGAQGAVFNAAGIQGSANLGQQYTQVLQPAYTQASTIKDKLVTFLQNNPDINPVTLSRGNALANALRGELSDPKAQQLAQLITEYTNTLSPIIGVTGGTVTDFKQGLVNALLNPNANNQSLQQMVGSLQDIVGGKLNDFVKSGTGQGAIPPTSSEFQEGQRSSDGSLIFTGGQWKPAQ